MTRLFVFEMRTMTAATASKLPKPASSHPKLSQPSQTRLKALRGSENEREGSLTTALKKDNFLETPLQSIQNTQMSPSSQAPASWSEDARDAFEERAAFLEYDAGFPRPKAERAALAQTRKDHPR